MLHKCSKCRVTRTAFVADVGPHPRDGADAAPCALSLYELPLQLLLTEPLLVLQMLLHLAIKHSQWNLDGCTLGRNRGEIFRYTLRRAHEEGGGGGGEEQLGQLESTPALRSSPSTHTLECESYSAVPAHSNAHIAVLHLTALFVGNQNLILSKKQGERRAGRGAGQQSMAQVAVCMQQCIEASGRVMNVPKNLT